MMMGKEERGIHTHLEKDVPQAVVLRFSVDSHPIYIHLTAVLAHLLTLVCKMHTP